MSDELRSPIKHHLMLHQISETGLRCVKPMLLVRTKAAAKHLEVLAEIEEREGDALQAPYRPTTSDVL